MEEQNITNLPTMTFIELLTKLEEMDKPTMKPTLKCLLIFFCHSKSLHLLNNYNLVISIYLIWTCNQFELVHYHNDHDYQVYETMVCLPTDLNYKLVQIFL